MLRYIVQHPLLAVLNVASVALGVAVYLAIQIANGSANRAFAATIDIVAGKADLQITRAAKGLPEEIFPAVAHCRGIAAATPLVRGLVTLPDLPGEYLHVLGVDIFTNEAFRTFELTDFRAGQFDVQRWLGQSDAIAITEEFARQHHLKSGDRLRVQLNGADRELTVGFILQANRISIDPHFAAMDIGWAQELFARRGSLSAIQLRLTNAAERESVIADLRAVVPVDATISTPAQRGEQVENMLRAFQLNLTAMSLVSLLVGMFLIYNTVSASVVRRRHEIGILRSLGTTRREIRALFLGEPLVLGTIGTLLGLVGGVYLARGLVGTVSETISSLYVLLSMREIALAPKMFLSAAGAGLFSVLLAAWLPARAAARMDPVQALRAGTIIEQSANLSRAWFWFGLLVISLAALLSVAALRAGPPWI
ncbi:MAG: ABC transporter permease, partial [Chthoniobacterales bacterium]